MATANLRQFLEGLKDGDEFAARDVLFIARRRKTVYGALYRLNKLGEICRVAQGVYIKGDDKTPKPSIERIAHTKARAFCKTITEVSREFARRIGIIFQAKSEAIFATNGRSSVIRSCHGPIQFVGASLRKIALQDSAVGVQLRTVWHFGRQSDPAPFIQTVAAEWSESDWQESNARFKLLPEWLAVNLPLPLANTGRSPLLLE